jgi:hypothetical protein
MTLSPYLKLKLNCEISTKIDSYIKYNNNLVFLRENKFPLGLFVSLVII